MKSERSWQTIVAAGLAAAERAQTGSMCSVVDHELVPGGDPRGIDATIWLICRNRSEQRQFADTERTRFVAELKRQLLAEGLDEAIVDSLRFQVSSRDEIEQRGGYSFIRLR